MFEVLKYIRRFEEQCLDLHLLASLTQLLQNVLELHNVTWLPHTKNNGAALLFLVSMLRMCLKDSITTLTVCVQDIFWGCLLKG